MQLWARMDTIPIPLPDRRGASGLSPPSSGVKIPVTDHDQPW